ncbi:MAG: hypothetical protein CVT85_04645 [Alphaproteobacteria bacterium HGW-Alphaproteobacteria-7]|jgi:hypothetical protein|nr:MAG: hypothetical protein CVT85_04645 [Alphaproteobacteria bacterium HGW-Alphaproteobacteria-7]
MVQHNLWDRRRIMLGLAAVSLAGMMPSGAHAQGVFGKRKGKGLGLSSILGNATDNALDTLAQPGAFYDDEAIRIGLPLVGKLGGGGGLLGSVIGAGNRLGVLDGLTRGINDAAGVAAGEAKPIFREAIDGLSFTDAPDIIREDDGGTQYLRRSATDRLHERLEPLVDTALDQAGIYRQFDSLADQHSFIRSAGLNRQSINRSVTDQGLDGIFAYIANEERGFRKNPLKGLGGVF